MRHKKNQFLFLTSEFVSSLGDIIGFIGISWWVFDQTNDIMAMAKVSGPSGILRIVSPFFLGIFADQKNRKNILLASHFISLLVWTFIFIMLINNYFNLYFLSLCLIITTLSISLFRVASAGFLTDIVPRENYPQVVGQLQSVSAFNRILATCIGGVLISTISVQGTTLVNIVSFSLAFLTLIFIKKLKNNESKEEMTSIPMKPQTESILENFKMMINFLKKDRFFQSMIIFITVSQFVLIPLATLLVPYVKIFRNLPSSYLGLFETASAVGVLLGSLSIKKSQASDSPLILLGVSLGFFMLAGFKGLALPALGLFIIHYCFLRYIIPLRSKLILHFDNDMRGKVSGFMATFIELSGFLGIFTWTAIAEFWNMQISFIVMGLFALILIALTKLGVDSYELPTSNCRS